MAVEGVAGPVLLHAGDSAVEEAGEVHQILKDQEEAEAVAAVLRLPEQLQVAVEEAEAQEALR